MPRRKSPGTVRTFTPAEAKALAGGVAHSADPAHGGSQASVQAATEPYFTQRRHLHARTADLVRVLPVECRVRTCDRIASLLRRNGVTLAAYDAIACDDGDRPDGTRIAADGRLDRLLMDMRGMLTDQYDFRSAGGDSDRMMESGRVALNQLLAIEAGIVAIVARQSLALTRPPHPLPPNRKDPDA